MVPRVLSLGETKAGPSGGNWMRQNDLDCLPADDSTPALSGVRAGLAAGLPAPWGFNSVTGPLVPVCGAATAAPEPYYQPPRPCAGQAATLTANT